MRMNSLFLRNQLSLWWWCGRGVFVKLSLALIRIQLFWSSFMNTYIRSSSMNSTFLPFLARVRNGRMKELKNASRGGKLDAGWKRCNPAPGCRHKLPKFDKISFTQSIQLTLVHSPQRQILDPLTPSRCRGRAELGYTRGSAGRRGG